jgi:transglutaminase-like putative cysteine protease
MAATTETAETGEHRGFLLSSLLLLGAASGAVFGRVFEGGGAAFRLILAGVLAVALADLLRRRHILVSVAVSAGALFLVLTYFVFPDTTWRGLPSVETLRALRDALDVLGREATREVAPAPPLPSLMTASITAVWTAATASHALAVRSRSSLLPLLPPAALLGFAGVVTEEGPRPGYVTALLLAALAVVFAVGVDRLGAWGRIVPGRRRRSAGSSAFRNAAWIAAGSVVVALLLPGVLPGYGAGSVVRFEGGTGPISINPIVDIRPSLRRNPPRELLLVDADLPAYWRMMALDRFDGRLWTASDLYAQGGSAVRGSQALHGNYRPGVLLSQTIEVRELATAWLPAAFDPTEIAVGEGDVLRFDREGSVLVRPQGVPEGFTYRVVSNLVAPTADELRSAYENVHIDADSTYAPYLALPPGLPDAIGDMAREIVDDAGAQTPYDQVLAIQEHLRGFEYDERVTAGHDTNDIVRFLRTTRRGYCEQFAGTMAVLVRTLGLPSRVAVGFLPGNQDIEGRFHVTTKHAHVWPEIYFPGHGWLAFEPTPSRHNPVGASYLVPGADGGGRGGQGGGPGGQDEAPGIQTREEFNATGTSFQEAPEAPSPGEEPAPFPWGAIALALLATVAVVAAFAAAAKAVARRVALSRSGTPAQAVRRAYRVMEASASDLGLARDRSETLWEYRDRLLRRSQFSDGHLERLTSLAGRAMYSPRPPGPGEARDAAEATRAAVRDLRREAGPVRTIMGAVRPSPPL